MFGPSLGFFDSTATLSRLQTSEGVDGSGAPVTSYLSVVDYDDLICSIQPAGGSVKWYYAQRQIEVTHEVFFDVMIPVRLGDRFEFSNGRILTVMGWQNECEQNRLFVVHGYDVKQG